MLPSSNGQSPTSAMMSSLVDNRKSRPSPTPTPNLTPTSEFDIDLIKPTKVCPSPVKPTRKPSTVPTRKPIRKSSTLINIKSAGLAAITKVNNRNFVV